MDGDKVKRGANRRRASRGVENRDVCLSKSMSYALRHGACQMGLCMNTDGFLYVDDLLVHPQFRSYSLEDVKRVVATNDKQRFKLRPHPENGRLQIRANQGHTVQVRDLELRPVLRGSADCPSEAVHGTYLNRWDSIRQQGLSRMNRIHIHLASALPGEEGVISDGIQFFWSENGVLLSPGDAEGRLLPKYFSRALQLKPTKGRGELELIPAIQTLDERQGTPWTGRQSIAGLTYRDRQSHSHTYGQFRVTN